MLTPLEVPCLRNGHRRGPLPVPPLPAPGVSMPYPTQPVRLSLWVGLFVWALERRGGDGVSPQCSDETRALSLPEEEHLEE